MLSPMFSVQGQVQEEPGCCSLVRFLIRPVVKTLCSSSPIILILGIACLASRSAPLAELRSIAGADPDQDFVAVAAKCSILGKYDLKQTVFTALQGPCAGFRQMYKVLAPAPSANSTVNCWKPSNMRALHEKGVMEYYRCDTTTVKWIYNQTGDVSTKHDQQLECQCWLIDSPEHILAEAH
eukprot:3465162-Rhodomonas_salina.1